MNRLNLREIICFFLNIFKGVYVHSFVDFAKVLWTLSELSNLYFDPKTFFLTKYG